PLALYHRLLQRHPNDLDTLPAAANGPAAQSDLPDAEAYLHRALAQAPESPEVLAAAGRAYRSAGKNRKAEQYFRASLAAQQRQAGQLDIGLPAAHGSAAVASAGRPLNPFSGITGGMRSSPAGLSERLDAAAASYDSAQPVAVSQAPARYASAAPASIDGGSGGDLPPPVSGSAGPAPVPMANQRSRLPTRSGAYAAPAAPGRNDAY
ncbi:cellulose synthase, partial [Xanthomonas campestris]